MNVMSNKNNTQRNIAAAEATRRTTTTSSITIPLVIVEDHNHVLEHIHNAIRNLYKKKQHSNNNRQESKKRRHYCHTTDNNICEPSLLSSSSSDDSSFPSTTTTSLYMIHFDAHPDLAVSRAFSAQSCYQPRDLKLYEALDLSEGGIAEWILPLVFAGMVKHVDWVHHNYSYDDDDIADVNDCNEEDLLLLSSCSCSSCSMASSSLEERVSSFIIEGGGDNNCYHHSHRWMNQIEDGDYEINVGAVVRNNNNNEHGSSSSSKSIIKGLKCDDSSIITHYLDLPNSAFLAVDLVHPYFKEDEVVPTSNLLLPQKLHLRVSALDKYSFRRDTRSSSSAAFAETTAEPSSGSNCRDWVLDVCLDFFACTNPFRLEVEKLMGGVFANKLYDIVQLGERHCRTIHREKQNINEGATATVFRSIQDFHGLLNKFLLYKATNTNNNSSNDNNDDQRKNHLLNQLLSMYLPPLSLELNSVLISDLKSIAKEMESLTLEIKHCVTNAVPHMTLPHLLNCFSEKRVSQRLDRFHRTLNEIKEKFCNPPFIITIARSSVDEYTPVGLVESIQDKVLIILHKVFCESICCESRRDDPTTTNKKHDTYECSKIKVVRDYELTHNAVQKMRA